MAKQRRTPAYCLHSPSGQARCRINGRDFYLGKFGSPESRQLYDDLIADWLAKQDASRLLLNIDDLALLFMKHAEAYYRHKDGSSSFYERR